MYACTFFFTRLANFSFPFPWRAIFLFQWLNTSFKRGKRRRGGEVGKKNETACKRESDIAGCCVWRWDAVSGSGLPAWCRHHVRSYWDGSLKPTWARRRWIFKNILFCRCGVVDKMLSLKTAKQRFISGTVGLKHSQTSWCTLTVPTPQNYTSDPPTWACILFFLLHSPEVRN